MKLITLGILVTFMCVHGTTILQNRTSLPSNDSNNSSNISTDQYTDGNPAKPAISDEESLRRNWNNVSNVYKRKNNPVSNANFMSAANIYGNFCVKHDNVLYASVVVKILSLGTVASNGSKSLFEKRWTIAPKHKGASVSVMKRDNIVSEDIFKGGCSNIHIFQSYFNRTSKTWCQNQRLLPCDPIWQIQYSLYGYTPVSEPGKAISIIRTPFAADYGYRKDDFSSLYYYECGGIRSRGFVRSPRFPSDVDPSRNLVYCKWDVLLERGSDYSILRILDIHLPDCKNQQLIIFQDTLLHESEVTDSLLKTMQRHANRTLNSVEYEDLIDEDVSMKYMHVYRDERLTAIQVAQNPKAGIHLVQKTTLCGSQQPTMNFVWKKHSTQVSLILQSKNSTLRSEGFSAVLSTLSRQKMIHRNGNSEANEEIGDPPIVSNIISKYIALIVLIPIGITVALSIMICMLKRRSPANTSGKSPKSHKEINGTRSGTSYLRGRFCSTVSNSTSRHSSLQRTRSHDTLSLSTDKNRVSSSRKRKGSIINVKNLIGIRKLSLKLKTVYEEETSNQSKCDGLLVEEQKVTEPTVT